MRYALILSLLAAPAFAQSEVCPPVPDHSAEKDDIYLMLRRAQDEGTARVLGGELWQFWLDAPDDVAQDILDRGMAARQAFDYQGSVRILDELVAYCPDYAEGFNQRAFAHFLARNYDAALTDLERAVELDPRHLGALTGMAFTLMGLERDDEAQDVLRDALRLNPWLAERRLLEGPPEVEL